MALKGRLTNAKRSIKRRFRLPCRGDSLVAVRKVSAGGQLVDSPSCRCHGEHRKLLSKSKSLISVRLWLRTERFGCRNQAEVGHTCRGSINLQEARIHTENACNFIVSGSTQTFHLKAANEVERQKWVTGLELTRHRAIKAAESGKETAVDCARLPSVCFV
jgi:hypothetical protein